MVVRRTTYHSNIDKTKELVCGLQETEQRTPHPSPSTRHLWSGWASFKFLGVPSPRISHGLLTQMQCWRRHISVSSSWDGWGSLERAPESSGPSTPALWRASWPAVSPPGLETAPLATAGLCKGSCELPATLLEVSFPPSRISTPGGVQGKPGGYQRLQPPVHQHRLLSLLPSGRRFRSIRSRTSRLRDSFFPQAIRLMNIQKWPTLQHTPTHTTCHALHFNTVLPDYTHTSAITGHHTMHIHDTAYA